MRTRRIAAAALTGAVVAMLFFGAGVEACGPDFEPDVFIRASAPDNLAAFAQGKLGLLGAGYDSTVYAVAHRYLNGGRLSPAEQTAFLGKMEPPTVQDWSHLTPAEVEQAQKAQEAAALAAGASGQWLAAREPYGTTAAPNARQLAPSGDAALYYEPQYLDCPDAAFRTATLTLAKRAGAWGGRSPWLADWIHAQDAVFANCGNGKVDPFPPPDAPKPAPPEPVMPGAVPGNAPALLRQDRAYQTAAAEFYAMQFDAAAQHFNAIAKDAGSPWSRWGTYLAARALVRKAFATGKVTNPYGGDLASFDMATMQQAQTMLEGLLSHPEPSREAVTAELNFVRLRTEPEKRVNEICAALAGPGPDTNFRQDLDDLTFALEKQLPVKNPAPLYAWIEAWRGKPARGSAPAVWQQTHALPWLVLAIAQAGPKDADVPQLLAAAKAVAPATPAYQTVFYHRVRLLIETGEKDQARTLLEAALPERIAGKPDSFLNGLLAERMAVARSFDEFLTYAPRTILSGDLLTADTAPLWPCTRHPAWLTELGHCPTKGQPPGFDVDSVAVLNEQTPLALWVRAAESPDLPPNLHQYVVLAGWTRAVVLEDAATAATLARLLPPAVEKTAGTGVGYAAELAILENPGLRPYVETGASRLGDPNMLDDFRDNWWSTNWESRYQSASPLGKVDASGFLTAAQIAAGAAEAQRVQKISNGAAAIGQRVVDYAKTHANDTSVPEALALVVRATHYEAQDWSGNQDAMKAQQAAVTAVGKAAFTLLHARYPQSEWASKTPYYY
ncbi:MAG TPA: hypothetical protein VHX37_00260 [Acidobacteriaceae bacterium]|jgi:hypothetical protein|nr:hypothetical protein [Acidobacteriaceae bacterium]